MCSLVNIFLFFFQKVEYMACLDLITQDTLKGKLFCVFFGQGIPFGRKGRTENVLKSTTWSGYVLMVKMWSRYSTGEVIIGVSALNQVLKYLIVFAEIQNKRNERKRRSTANPQFAYGHFEPEVCFMLKIKKKFFLISLCAVCTHIFHCFFCILIFNWPFVARNNSSNVVTFGKNFLNILCKPKLLHKVTVSEKKKAELTLIQ